MIDISFFGPLVGDLLTVAFVLLKWANVKVTVIKNIGYVPFNLPTLNCS
jgi:hypothetical protein